MGMDEKTRNVTLSVELERMREERLVEGTPESTQTLFLKADLQKVGDENQGLKTKIRSLRANIEMNKETIEAERKKYKKLETAYEIEKQKDKEPKTILAEKDKKH